MNRKDRFVSATWAEWIAPESMRRTTMKRMKWMAVSLVLASLVSASAGAAQASPDAVRVKLSRPSDPCVLECGLVHGGIRVTAYDGDEVIVETLAREEEESSSDRSRERSGEKDSPKAGLKKLAVRSASLTLVEKDNRISIDGSPWANGMDLDIRVPRKTSLELTCVNDGDIRVEGVSGNVELQNVNGSITVLKVSGSLIAATTNGDVTVDMKAVDSGKPMSFVTFNGDVNVTLPPGVKATVKMETGQGDAYSDFDIAESGKKPKMIEENTRDKDGAYRVRVEEAFYGDINGGGPEFYFRTFNGDIYVRKGI